MIFEVFQLDMSGRLINELHPANKLFISVMLDVSHFDISGNDSKVEHNEKTPNNWVIFSKFHLDISCKDFNIVLL